MTAAPISREQFLALRALEALRNGVPNGDAVRELGCMQPAAVDVFVERLEELRSAGEASDPRHVSGVLISGGFGSGKSHTLEFFEQQALARGFVVSKIVVSKETPLYDPAKLFLAAIREARLPDGRGPLVDELVMRISPNAPLLGSFSAWVMQRQPIGIIGASWTVHERTMDLGLQQRIVDFWSGEPITVRELRSALRDLGIPNAYNVERTSPALLAPIRFEFAARLARAVGFAGWVILIDEVELIARYGLLQRAKSYATLAFLLGGLPGQGIRGTTVVAAITDDFALHVLEERGDREKAPARLARASDEKSLAASTLAMAGISLIADRAIGLNPPNDDSLEASYRRVRDLYERAHGTVPVNRGQLRRGSHRPMRSYVREWIADWDLARLYPDQEARVHVEDVPRVAMEEDPDLQAQGEGDVEGSETSTPS